MRDVKVENSTRRLLFHRGIKRKSRVVVMQGRQN